MSRTEEHFAIFSCDICAKVVRDRIDAPMPRGWFLIAMGLAETIVCGQDCGQEAVIGMADEYDRWEAERARLESLQHAKGEDWPVTAARQAITGDEHEGARRMTDDFERAAGSLS